MSMAPYTRHVELGYFLRGEKLRDLTGVGNPAKVIHDLVDLGNSVRLLFRCSTVSCDSLIAFPDGNLPMSVPSTRKP